MSLMPAKGEKEVRVEGRWYRVAVRDGRAVYVLGQFAVPRRGGIKTWKTVWHFDTGRTPGPVAAAAIAAALPAPSAP